MRTSTIELLGRTYPLCFSLTAAREMDSAFGGLESLYQRIQSGSPVQRASAINQALEILLKAGRIYVSARDGDLPEAPPRPPTDLLDMTDGTAIQAIFSTIANDTDREVEAVPKKQGSHAEAAGTAWLYYSGAQAGLTRFEVDHLPMGLVFDQIACWQLAMGIAEEKDVPQGSLAEQMAGHYGR